MELEPVPLTCLCLSCGEAFHPQGINGFCPFCTSTWVETNFSLPYLESALFLFAEHQGEEGVYCLSLPATDDMALIGGREVFGYPKKIANIYMKHDKEKVEGWTERHGTRFFEVSVRLTGKFNEQVLQQMMMERMASPTSLDQVIYNFKYFPGPEISGFDYNPD